MKLTRVRDVITHCFLTLLVTTGEEEEDTIHQVRGKLFSLADGTLWKERGTGTLKLNVRRSDGNGARLGIACLLMKFSAV